MNASPAVRRLTHAGPFAFILTSSIATAIYWFTAPTDLTWAFYSADGAELITAAKTLGIPHPPGYPLFTILGFALIQLPLQIGIPARFIAVSALSMALASGMVTLSAKNLFGEKIGLSASVTAGLLFCTSSIVWQQAIVAEVYAVNALWVSLALWLITANRSGWLLGLVCGLAVVSHLTSLLLFPLILSKVLKKHWVQVGLGFGLGSMPWLLIPWFAIGDSPIIWGNPTTLQGFVWLISAELYRPNVFGNSMPLVMSRLQNWFPLLLRQLLGLWLILPILKGMTRPKQAWQEAVKLFPYWATALLYLLYSIGYRPDDAIVLLIPAVLIAATLLSSALKPLKFYAFLLPLLLFGLNFTSVFIEDSQYPRQMTLELMQQIPENALVISDGQDQTIFTLWYFHHVEEIRPDISIIDTNLIAFDWYRQRQTGSAANLFPLQEDNLDLLVANELEKRPVCFVSLAPPVNNCLNHE